MCNFVFVEPPFLGFNARPFKRKPVRIVPESARNIKIFAETIVVVSCQPRYIIFFLQRVWVALKDICRPCSRLCAFNVALRTFLLPLRPIVAVVALHLVCAGGGSP